MPAQSTETKFKILIAALSQSPTSEKEFLPAPNYNKLAADLGLPSYASAQGVWRRLMKEFEKGSFGDLKIREEGAETKTPTKTPAGGGKSKASSASPAKKRASEDTNDPQASPTKKSKATSGKRGESKGVDNGGRNRADKESDGGVVKTKVDWMENPQVDTVSGI